MTLNEILGRFMLSSFASSEADEGNEAAFFNPI